MTSDTGHLLWFAGVSWDAVRGTDRLMANAMTRYGDILWVDPPVSPLTPASRRFGAARSLRPVISAVDDRITRLTPIALPGLGRPMIRLTTVPLVCGQIRWALRRLRIRPRAVMASHLEDVLGRWGARVVNVLYGTDDFVAGAELMELSARRLRRLERRALAKADVAVVVSPQLAERWTTLGARPVLIPNGCLLARRTGEIPLSTMPELPPPVVGLVGQLNERIDLDILNRIVDAGFSLLMIGPRDPRWEPQRFAALIARPCVHYAGAVAAEAVPTYLAAIDVGITPYRASAFNRASFPLKTLEYLGAGRPVVSTDLPAARWLRQDLARSDQAALAEQILVLAGEPAEFIAALRRLAGDPASPTGAKRGPGQRALEPAIADNCIAFAERHSWSRRADAFAAAIGLTVPACEHSEPSPNHR